MNPPVHDQDTSKWGRMRLANASLLRRLERYIGIGLHGVRYKVRTAEEPPPVEVPPGVQLQVLTLDDVKRHLHEPDLGLALGSFRFALANDHVPLGLYIGDRLVHYTIYGHTVAPGPRGLMVRLSPRHRYIYRTFTHPDFRGQRLPSVRGYLAHRNGLGPQLEASISYVALHNLASSAMSDRFGELIAGYAGYLPLGRDRYWCFASPGARALEFRFDQPTAEERALLRD